MSLTRAVAWNTAIQVAGRALGLLASMAVTAILVRHLGHASYGQLITATTYTGFFSVLGDAGLYLSIVRRAAQDPERRAAILGAGLGLRAIVAAVPLLLGYGLIQMVPSTVFPTYVAAVKVAVAVCALNNYVTLLNQLYIAVFRLHLRMDLAVLGEMLARVTMLGAVALVVHFGGGVVACCWALAAGTACTFAYGALVTRRFETIRPHFDWPLSRALMSESVALTAVTLLGLVHFKVDTLILSVLRPPEDVGIYGVAYKLHEVLITFPGLFVGLLFPVFSRLATHDTARLQQVFQRTFEVLLLASVGAALLLIVLAPPLAAILGAIEATQTMRILALALPPVFVSLGFTHLLLAEGRQSWLVRMYVFLVIANIGGNFIAIRLWSYRGAAAVTVLTESLALACLAVYWLGRRRWSLELRVLLAIPVAILLGLGGDFVQRHFAIATAPPVGRVLGTGLLGVAIAALFALTILGLRLVPVATLRQLLRRDAAATDSIL